MIFADIVCMYYAIRLIYLQPFSKACLDSLNVYFLWFLPGSHWFPFTSVQHEKQPTESRVKAWGVKYINVEMESDVSRQPRILSKLHHCCMVIQCKGYLSWFDYQNLMLQYCNFEKEKKKQKLRICLLWWISLESLKSIQVQLQCALETLSSNVVVQLIWQLMDSNIRKILQWSIKMN